MLNLRSKLFGNFFIYQTLYTEYFTGGSGSTFFVTPNLRPKNFSEFFNLQSTLDSEFFRGVFYGHQLFWVMPNLRSKMFSELFPLLSALDSEFFEGGIRAPTFFGDAKIEVKKFSEFFPF